MDVRIEFLPETLAVCMRHIGSYQSVGETFKRMYAWASGVGALTTDTRIMGLSYDDPNVVPQSQLRYDVCFSVAGPIEPMPADGRLETLSGGRYAIYRLKGPYSGMHDAFMRIYREWLPANGEVAADAPCIEIYLNDAADVPAENLLTDLCVPLKDQ
jgi:AraC family transcriptional regulator